MARRGDGICLRGKTWRLVVVLVFIGCASTPPDSMSTPDRYGGGTEAERADALMQCRERTNEAFKYRGATGSAVERLHREMTEHTDLCMRARGFQVSTERTRRP
jgi:hypothetical protein